VDVTWQWIAVLAIEIGAIAFLAHRLFGRVAPAAPRRKPDVPTSALLRKKR
jgi:hypothetical protein